MRQIYMLPERRRKFGRICRVGAGVHFVEDTVEWIHGAHKDAKELSQIPFAIINLEKGKAVGSTRYMDISRPDWRVEIGWTWLAVSEWRTPITPSANICY